MTAFSAWRSHTLYRAAPARVCFWDEASLGPRGFSLFLPELGRRFLPDSRALVRLTELINRHFDSSCRSQVGPGLLSQRTHWWCDRHRG